ncbi:MAG: bifunctional (p)ppGpp synthetase/guanosine-3',5'-bis(diphosphate) 3'-pyrophosphohydrolase [Lachnospiraceae bacterium]|nr:bifunctional (p)ppGpp synthetase/guanosine-3',5'-bis(diphosphate) 3'-pyrophosphohydrolase [Lachnospiraceae bacterium]
MAEERRNEVNNEKKEQSLSLSGKPESEKSLSRINAPAAPLNPEERFEKLIEIVQSYHPSSDISEIRKAYTVAKESHGNQKRHSGEPYITHPVEVAIILAELEMDKETIIAGLLHDVVEDTPTTLDNLKEQFGTEVAELVDGVTKLTQIKYSADKIEVQAENLRKMFLAMAKDIRVIIIKLADRLHNMRTLQYMTREKQKEKARETMDIYSPIAQRLGISKIKIELDDLALKYSEPDVYYNLVENIKIRRSAREDFVSKMVEEIKQHMAEANIDCEVDGRVKHFFSIYKKMLNQNRSLDQIYDLFAVRIKVETVKDCYAALGIIHEVYKPIPGRFKDYIAMPKPNMYQSLHTTLISPSGQPFEVQIRTFEMHRTAEYGIAAHWKYKEGIGVNSKTIKQSEEEKLAWLRQILDWQNEMSDNKEFMEFLKSDLDLFSDNVFCFTPQGDVKNLPAGSTPIDFAYAIHSAVGNKMIGARVNDKIVTIDYKIQNGDRIEIITSQNSKGPSMDWLNIVKSPSAKQKINQWFRNALKEENIVRGKEMVEKYMKAKGLDNMDIFQPEYQAPVLARYSCKDWDSVLAAIGHGGLKEGQIVNRVLDEYNRKNKKNEMTDEDVLGSAASSKPASEMKHGNGIVVKGIHDVAVRFAKCCSPVPGDEIVGFVTRGRGITVHRTDCVNIVNLSSIERSRLIDAQWDKPSSAFKEEKYQVEISIYARNRVGMLVDISKIMSEKNLDVTNMNVRINKQQIATIDMGFKVSSTDELSKVIDKLKAIDGIIDINRTTG